jgi:hypothetical protein
LAYRPQAPLEGSLFRPFSYTVHTHKLVWKKLERKSSACALGKRKNRKEKEKKKRKGKEKFP